MKVVLDKVVDVGFGLWVDVCTSSSTFEEGSGKARVFGEVFDRVAIDLGVYEGAD